MLDLDPQTSLTFSFILPDVWERDFSGEIPGATDKTIKAWLEAFGGWLIALSQVLPYLAAYRTLKPDLDFGFARRPSRPVAYRSLSFCDASHV